MRISAGEHRLLSASSGRGGVHETPAVRLWGEFPLNNSGTVSEENGLWPVGTDF